MQDGGETDFYSYWELSNLNAELIKFGQHYAELKCGQHHGIGRLDWNNFPKAVPVDEMNQEHTHRTIDLKLWFRDVVKLFGAKKESFKMVLATEQDSYDSDVLLKNHLYRRWCSTRYMKLFEWITQERQREIDAHKPGRKEDFFVKR